jgi:BASS family bile acid:Na+ symporter
MTLVAGFWGVWHIIAGLSLAWWWSRVPLPQLAGETA